MKKIIIALAFAGITQFAKAQTAPPQQLAPPQDKQITITLPLSVWNTIMELLLTGEYKKVAPIIGEIQQQATVQLQPPQLPQSKDSTTSKQPAVKPKK